MNAESKRDLQLAIKCIQDAIRLIERAEKRDDRSYCNVYDLKHELQSLRLELD